MKRTIFIVFIGLLFILVGCNSTGSVDIVKQEPEPVEVSTDAAPVDETSNEESKTVSETDLIQIEKPVDTSPVQISTPEPNINLGADDKTVGPVLLDTLNRDCKINEERENFNNTGLAEGETAVDFTLKDINGNEHRLSQLLAEKPVVIILGSFT